MQDGDGESQTEMLDEVVGVGQHVDGARLHVDDDRVQLESEVAVLVGDGSTNYFRCDAAAAAAIFIARLRRFRLLIQLLRRRRSGRCRRQQLFPVASS